MTTTYSYDHDNLLVSKLSAEILGSLITNVLTEFEGLEDTKEATPAENLHVTFTNALSGGDKTLLDGLVAAHDDSYTHLQEEIFLGTALGYSGSGSLKNKAGIQYSKVPLRQGARLTYGVIVVDDREELPNSAALEISIYADSGSNPTGSKLATTGVLAVGALAQGKNELAFTTPYTVPAKGYYWIGISNFDDGKLRVAMTPGKKRKGIFNGQATFDEVSTSQPDPVVPGNLADSTSALVYVAVKG